MKTALEIEINEAFEKTAVAVERLPEGEFKKAALEMLDSSRAYAQLAIGEADLRTRIASRPTVACSQRQNANTEDQIQNALLKEEEAWERRGRMTIWAPAWREGQRGGPR